MRKKRYQLERVSVRKLVEFILRSGDIREYSGGIRGTEAMHNGTKIHKILQRKKGASYMPEVALTAAKDVEYDGLSVCIQVYGRADGIIKSGNEVTVNEIKSMVRDVTTFDAADSMHIAQAKCYGAMYALENDVDAVNIQITYCQMETMLMNEFEETYTAEELLEWFDGLLKEYAKWVVWRIRWKEARDASIKKMNFPFEYRKGQFELVKNIYFTILRKKNIFIQAPTGVGKTISTVFPSVSAVGEGLLDKILYLTAKTITRTVAEDTFKILSDQGVMLKCVTITAKDKICILPKASCNPENCSRAKGHFDRVNDAVYELLTTEQNITRQLICEYAEKYSVCPYEMCLDISDWCDVIICDYNYVFDPNVCIKRLFSDEDNKRDYILLIDEAHNLIHRAREMYSIGIEAGLVRDVKKSVKNIDGKLYRALDGVNRSLLAFKRECDEFAVYESVGGLIFQLMRAVTEFDGFLRDVLPKKKDFTNTENLFQLYFDIRYFLVISEALDERYRICGSYTERGEFCLTLKCMDPSHMLKEYLDKVKSAVFFSATLLPVKYYMQQLGANEDDYAVYAESSFDIKNQLVLAARDVSTKYTRRTMEEYIRITGYIKEFVAAKRGNYLIFFTSYKMLNDIYSLMPQDEYVYIVQHENMSEEEREEFLESFNVTDDVTKLGLCVLGGVFGEGIDLQNDRLIGTVIVGTGLPMVGDERELFRYYYDEANGKGFEYAYLYPGMNKVLQAAGRVIRTASDRGCILLLDDRFVTKQYACLFPREWRHMKYIRFNEMKPLLDEFWSEEINIEDNNKGEDVYGNTTH